MFLATSGRDITFKFALFELAADSIEKWLSTVPALQTPHKLTSKTNFQLVMTDRGNADAVKQTLYPPVPHRFLRFDKLP